MKEIGIIKLDSKRGKELGFISNRFTGLSYLWEFEDCIIISLIESTEEGKGYLSYLFKSILAEGKAIKVPTPLKKMLPILKHKGFKQTGEICPAMGLVEIWIKE